MKLATLKDGTRDGRLVVVKRDGTAYASAEGISHTLQHALDEWEVKEPGLRALAAALEAGRAPSQPLDVHHLHSPLPRAYEWVDASAYLEHVRRVRRARGAEAPPGLETDPLVYQGGSGIFLDPTGDIPCRDPEWGLDFEGEVGVVLGDVPMGTRAAEAGLYVRLLVLCNDVSLRNLIPGELAKGFGFFQGKPAGAFGPFAVTPDELGPAWRDGRVHGRLRCHVNGRLVGDPDAGEMHFSFFQLVEHIARTRDFTAGTLLGGGTVSNAERARGVSCLAEQRVLETLEGGAAVTPYLKAGDTVELELLDAQGVSVFGRIAQRVVGAP